MMKRIMLQLIAVMIIAALLGCAAGSQEFQRGERYSQRGEWDMAVKEYRAANKRDPQDIQYRSALLRAQEMAANEHYKKARSFLQERKLDQAITELQQSIYLNPNNAAIQSALKSVLNMKDAENHYRTSLSFVELGRLSDAINELNQAVALDPENVKYRDALDKLQKQETEIEPEDALTLASDKLITLNFKNTNIKDVFEFLSKLSGINILFDEEVKAQPVTIFVKDVSFQYALNLLLSTNKLFMKKISADTIIVIPKSKAKTDQYQDLMVKTFYINNAKAKDMVNVLKTMLDLKKVYVNDALNSITIRDTPEKLKLIEKIIVDNDLKEAEVILDVEVLEIGRTNAQTYGWDFQPALSASATIQNPSGATNVPASGSGIAINQISSKNIFVTLPSVVVNLIKQDSDAQTLANPRIRIMSNRKASFMVGDKIPVQTSTIQSTATAAVTSTFEYKDIGIKLNIEPIVHLDNTMTLNLKVEVSTLGNLLSFGNGQQQYEFGNRSTETIINLRDGETVIIGGLISDDERKTLIKIPILGDLPVLGRLFQNNDSSTIKTDILMSITPNIVRSLELPSKDAQSFWSGTEEAYDTKPLFFLTGKSSKPSEKPLDKTAVLESMAKRETPAGPAQGEAPKMATVPTITGAPSTTGPVLLEIKPSDATMQLGQETRFEITAGKIKDLYGAILTLSYDPKVAEFMHASEGGLLKSDGQPTSFLFSNNTKNGTVDIYMTRIGNVGGANGSGNLCTVTFQGKAGGSSELGLRSVKLTNFKKEPIKADLKSAKVVVK
ncbi:MAG TPA: secretin N-terminal domain-containing protein [Nitrospirota bacterium]|nr:secretin N-terminal domain-containing protein [Nitrospirota bacterium]